MHSSVEQEVEKIALVFLKKWLPTLAGTKPIDADSEIYGLIIHEAVDMVAKARELGGEKGVLWMVRFLNHIPTQSSALRAAFVAITV
ncbi:MAG: hypothetical protein EOP04_09000 [Proteobacteria bacterium]|nr:MAG: hypothetical protein EOP04_09000 [Pseudomonadota bacterium]